MAENDSNQSQEKLSYQKKVWIAGGILTLLIVLLLLFKTLFSILLLTLAAALFAIYFHGCASFFKRHLHVSSGWSLALSIVINLILFVVFI